MALQASNIADLVSSTLNELGRLKFTDLMADYNRTIVLKRLMRKSKMTFDSGKAISFNVLTTTGTNNRFVGLYATDVTDVTNGLTTGEVPWRHFTWSWAMDRREVAMNASDSKIVDLIKSRRYIEFGGAIVKMEQRFWRAPSSTDDVSPYGLPYWVVKNASEGFNGGAPSGFTTVGGINPTTYARWKNWTAQYTTVSKDDLIRKMRKAMFYTDFDTLVDDIPTYNTGDDQAIYTNYSVVQTMEEILEAQNENLGNDVAPMDGRVRFRNIPITPVYELDGDTTNPVYGINWGEFFTAGLKGEWMKETQIPIQPGQHTVSATHTDATFNWMTRNRRRHFVIATGTGGLGN